MEVTPEKLQGACREVLGHSDMVPWTLEKVLDEYAAPPVCWRVPITISACASRLNVCIAMENGSFHRCAVHVSMCFPWNMFKHRLMILSQPRWTRGSAAQKKNGKSQVENAGCQVQSPILKETGRWRDGNGRATLVGVRGFSRSPTSDWLVYKLCVKLNAWTWFGYVDDFGVLGQVDLIVCFGNDLKLRSSYKFTTCPFQRAAFVFFCQAPTRRCGWTVGSMVPWIWILGWETLRLQIGKNPGFEKWVTLR